MENHPDAIRVYEKRYRLCNRSNTCISGLTIVSAAATLTANRYEEQSARMKILVPALTLNGAMIVSGIVLASKGKYLLRKFVAMYNTGAGKEEPLTFSLTGNEAGLIPAWLAFQKAREGLRSKYDPFYWAAFVLME